MGISMGQRQRLHQTTKNRTGTESELDSGQNLARIWPESSWNLAGIQLESGQRHQMIFETAIFKRIFYLPDD